jgi:2-haloacid dehalogenase
MLREEIAMAALYVFDAYGTLLDVHSAVSKHAPSIGSDAARFSELWRAKQLEYTWTLSLMGRYESFWTLTERALDFAFAKFAHVDRRLRTPLLEAYRSLSAYEDAANTLEELRARGAKTAVLSNGDPAMLRTAFDSAGVTAKIDRLLSVQDVGVFKTDPRAYRLVLDSFDVKREDALFVSSNRWDVAGATAFGFRAMWINRGEVPDEYFDLPPIATSKSLAALLDWTLTT